MTAPEQLEADIIIKGAGPVGLAFANLLGVYGIRTLVLEQNAGTVEEPRAVGLDTESSRALQAMGLTEATSADMLHGFSVDYLDAKGNVLMDVEVRDSPYGGAQMSSFNQPLFERQLLDGTKRFGQVSVLFNHRVDAVSQTDTHAIAEGQGPDGTPFEARARYLVGCGGGKSLVRRTTGIRMLGYSNPQPWLVIDTIDPQLDDWVDCRFFCDPARPAMTIRKRHQHRRWEWMLHPGETEEEFLDQSRIDALLAPYTDPAQVTLLRKCVYSFNSIVAEHYRQGRLFIAGDAAHMMPPFAGQGMNSGIRDAVNLSWKLAAVIKGKAAPSLLDTYETERRDHVVNLTKVANRLGRIIMPTAGWRAFLRDMVLKALTSFEAGKNALRGSFFITPKLGKGLFVKTGPGAAPRNGEMIVQPGVTDAQGRAGPLDDSLSKGFVILGIGADPAAELSERAIALCRDLEADLIHVARPGDRPAGPHLADTTGALTDWRGTAPPFVLLRPDRFAAAMFTATDAEAALTAFIGQMRAGGSD